MPDPSARSPVGGESLFAELAKPVTIDKLNSMRLAGMAKASRCATGRPESNNLPFEDRSALIVDVEFMKRENRQLAARLKSARLRQNAGHEA